MKNLVAKNEAPRSGVLYLYGDIYMSSYYDEDITPKDVMEAVSSMGDIDTLTIHINSNGGDVFAGVAIKNYLESLNAKIVVYVDALAASIASVIAMAADKGCLFMYSNTIMMIHEPWTFTVGNAKDLRDSADRLDQISSSTILESYKKRANISDEKIKEFMECEKWFSAKEALENGFCDEIIDNNSTTDYYQSKVISNYRNTPMQVINSVNQTDEMQKTIQSKILELELI